MEVAGAVTAAVTHRKINVRLARYIAEVALQDLSAAFYVWIGHHHVAIKSSRSNQSFVQGLWEVGGSHNNHSITGLEAAHKASFHQNTLLCRASPTNALADKDWSKAAFQDL